MNEICKHCGKVKSKHWDDGEYGINCHGGIGTSFEPSGLVAVSRELMEAVVKYFEKEAEQPVEYSQKISLYRLIRSLLAQMKKEG